MESGLPEDKKDSVSIGDNGTVMIRDLENSECLSLINTIHGKIYLSRRLYCNGVVPLTPEKASSDPSLPDNVIVDSVPENSLTLATPPQIEIREHLITDNVPSHALPNPISPMASPQWPTFEREELARRHSLSLLDRTPHKGSLADELLEPIVKQPKTQELMDNLRKLTETLSDFNSCISSSESSDHESLPTNAPQGRKKRKRIKSPGQKEHLKKGNFEVSPEKVVPTSN